MNKKLFVISGLILFFTLMISACGHKGDPQPPEGEAKPPKGKAYGTR
jgi:hypothetical protein